MSDDDISWWSDGSDDVDDDAVPEAISPDDLASKAKKLFREMPQRREKRFEPRAVARGKYLSLFLSSRKGKVWFNVASRGRVFEHRQKKKRETILKHLLAKEMTHKGGFVTIYTYLKYSWSFCTYFG